MPMTGIYTLADVGCYADSTTGHQHVREVLARIVGECFEGTEHWGAAEGLVSELCGDMSDDASEETDALDLLNTHVCDGVCFVFCDGDLVLVDPNEWED